MPAGAIAPASCIWPEYRPPGWCLERFSRSGLALEPKDQRSERVQVPPDFDPGHRSARTETPLHVHTRCANRKGRVPTHFGDDPIVSQRAIRRVADTTLCEISRCNCVPFVVGNPLYLPPRRARWRLPENLGANRFVAPEAKRTSAYSVEVDDPEQARHGDRRSPSPGWP